MQQTNDFFNDGFGWKCRPCYAEIRVPETETRAMPRYFLEGESEAKSPALADAARARWTDATRRSLTCPRCGITELIELN